MSARARLAPHARALLGAAIVAFASPAWADCFDDAGAYQGVNPTVLRAIAWFESKADPRAVHRNADGSVDVGQLQINSVHFGELARQGVPRRAIAQPCVNVYIAAWLLKRKMIQHGNTWLAIGAYHSESQRHRDAYARDIHAVLVKWGEAPAALAGD